jgi:hypothetical protein
MIESFLLTTSVCLVVLFVAVLEYFTVLYQYVLSFLMKDYPAT